MTLALLAATAAPAAGAADDGAVERLYLAYFLRGPDPDGLAYWQDLHEGGRPLTAISDAFAGSEEFQARYGALSDPDFVTLVYRNVLGRAPEPAGHRYWLDRMAAGMSRGTVMVGFSESAEFVSAHEAGLLPRASGGTVELGSDGLPTAPEGHYAFVELRDDGTPLTWAPCDTIGVVANLTGAPAGAEQALVDALEQLSGAMRISWRYEGTTDERSPSAIHVDRPLTDPARYGDRYSPVLVSWPTDWSDGGGSIGFGGFGAAMAGPGAPLHIVSGWVTLDRRWQPPDQGALLSLMLHELGHVANLAHVPHPEEVMYSGSGGHTTFQRGDLAGLAQLGAWTADCPS